MAGKSGFATTISLYCTWLPIFWNQRVRHQANCKGPKYLVRYTGSRYTSTREMKERTEQYGTVISIKSKKRKYEKTQKESMVCFAT